MTRLFDVLVAPFGAHRMAGLIVLSLLMGASLTLLYRATADAARIRRTRDIFKARVLEMRIYPDDMVLIGRALGGAIAAQGMYLRAAARPILIVLLVALPIFIQIESRYAHAPLAPGQSTLVTARLKPGLDVRSVPSNLVSDEAVNVDARSVRVAATREVAWRIDVTKPGRHDVEVKTYDQTYRLPITALNDNRAIGEQRRAHSFASSFTDVGLPQIGNDSALQAITIHYPDAHYRIFGMRMSWLGACLLASLVGAMIPAVLLRVAL